MDRAKDAIEKKVQELGAEIAMLGEERLIIEHRLAEILPRMDHLASALAEISKILIDLEKT